MASVTVKTLAEELAVDIDYIQTQLKRLGMKGDIEPDRGVSKSHADAIRQGHRAISEGLKKQIAESKGETGQETGQELATELATYTGKLTLKECDRIAERMGKSKAFVRDANKAMRSQRLILMAKLGAAEYEQEQQAKQAGREYAEIKVIQEQQAELLSLEKQIAIMQGTNTVDGILVNAGMGGLDEAIDAIQAQQEQDAKDRQKRQEIIDRMQEGHKPSEEELKDPFVSLAWDQISESRSYSAALGVMSA